MIWGHDNCDIPADSELLYSDMGRDYYFPVCTEHGILDAEELTKLVEGAD